MPRKSRLSVALLSLATAVPPHILVQEEAKAIARALFGGRTRLFDQMEPVFDNAGIARRHIVKPTDWYHGDHGWKARNQVYLEAAETLYVDAAQKALDRAGLAAADVDCLVKVSTTGIATPSLAARVWGRTGSGATAKGGALRGVG